MTRVDQLKDRIIDMIEKGCTRFGWTTGPEWHSLSIEQKADAILTMWDAPKVEGPPVSNKLPTDVHDLVNRLS